MYFRDQNRKDYFLVYEENMAKKQDTCRRQEGEGLSFGKIIHNPLQLSEFADFKAFSGRCFVVIHAFSR